VVEISGTVYGQLVSKSNSRRIVFNYNKPRSIKSEKAFFFEETAIMQIRKILGNKQPLIGPVGMNCTVFYPTKRQDLDVSLFMDVLQKAGAYKNDRQVFEMTLSKNVDKTNPRVEFSIWRIDE
jgi:Holliday junction resolvase RusA-like endonuclease